MAEPIEHKVQYDARESLIRKLREAPEIHSEAILDAYEILQLLRDKGILEIAKGLLGSGEKVMDIFSTTLGSDQSVTLLRNLVILTKILGGINPKMLEDVQSVLMQQANQEASAKPPGIFHSLRGIFSSDSLRFIGTISRVFESIGRSLSSNQAKSDSLIGKNRQKITPHNA